MARRGGLKLIFLLGGFDEFMLAEDFTEWTKNAKSRENFLTEVLGIVDKFNLQGVLFQWYFPGCPKVRDSKFSMPFNFNFPVNSASTRAFLFFFVTINPIQTCW
jgi:GH18 family chitinase